MPTPQTPKNQQAGVGESTIAWGKSEARTRGKLRRKKTSLRSRKLTNRYSTVRNDPTGSLFESIAHLSVCEFDALHELLKSEIDTPLDPYGFLTSRERLGLTRRRKLLSTKELLFLFLDVMSGGVCGSDGGCRTALQHGITADCAWKYFRHVAWSCFRGLSLLSPLRWPDAEERSCTEGLLNGFPKGVLFVDGTIQRVFRSKDYEVQNDQYNGKHKFHCFTTLLYCDVYGRIKRLETSASGRFHDKTLFCLSDVYVRKELSQGQQILLDAGFVGAGSAEWLIVSFKNGQGDDFEYRADWNRDLRSQRIRNEWGIGYMKNRHRIFMGAWPFSSELFPICMKVAAMIMNWRLSFTGKDLVPLSRMVERLSEGEMRAFISGAN